MKKKRWFDSFIRVSRVIRVIRGQRFGLNLIFRLFDRDSSPDAPDSWLLPSWLLVPSRPAPPLPPCTQ